MSLPFRIPSFRPAPFSAEPPCPDVGGNVLAGAAVSVPRGPPSRGASDGDIDRPARRHTRAVAGVRADRAVDPRPGRLPYERLHGAGRRQVERCRRADFSHGSPRLRGGEGLASHPYHAGRSGDTLTALQFVEKLCPRCPGDARRLLALGQYSAQAARRSAGRRAGQRGQGGRHLSRPSTSGLCARSLSGPFQRVYDRHFVRLLCRQVRFNRRTRSDLPPVADPRRLKTLVPFRRCVHGPCLRFWIGRQLLHDQQCGDDISKTSGFPR